MAYKLNNITDKVKNLLNGVPQNLNQVGRSIMDNKGFYQQGRLTAQPIQQAINNRVIKPAVNRLQQSPTLAKIQESIPNPINKISEGFSEASSMGLVDVPFRPSQNNIEKASYVTGSVLGYVNPLNPINKLGVFSKLDKFGKVALNPATSRIANPFLRKGYQALAGELAQSGAYIGAKKLSEAKGLSSKSNNNLATDVAFGLGMRGIGNIVPKGTIRVKGSIGNRPNNINPEDLGVSDRIKDFFRSVNKDTNPQSIRDAKNIIDDLAGKYLKKEEIDRVIEKARTTKSNDKFYEYLNDAIRTKFRKQEASYSYADNLALGITDKKLTAQQEVAKEKLPQIMYEDVISKAKKEIGPKQEIKGTIKEKFNELYTDWVNRFHPVESLTSSIEKTTKSNIRPEFNPKYTIKRLLGAGGVAELRHKKTLEPIFNELGDVDISDFDVFLKAKRDIELAGRGIKGSDAEIAQERLDALSQKYDVNNLNNVADKLYAYQRQGLEKLKQAGFLSEDAISNITTKNQKYVPFQRISDELDNFLGVPSPKLQQSSSPVLKIKGSDKAIESPIESIIANTYKVEAAIAKNNVAKSIVNLANIDPKFKTLFEKTTKGGDNTIAVWENGKKQFYTAPDDVVKVVKGLNEENMGTLVNILSIPSRFFRQQTTGRNPAFFIPNMVRDQFDAAINAKYGYVPFIDYMSGLGHLFKDKYLGGDELVEQWYKSGGSIFFENMGGRKEIRKQIEDATTNKKMMQKAWESLVGGIGVLGEFSEQPTRLGVFKRALNKTKNTDIAGFESREATLDFARMGAKMKAANSLIPFLNVGVQGFDKMIRVAKDNPAKIAMAMSGYALLPQTMVSMYNILFDPEGYAQVPDFEKQGNFIILDGKKDREGNPTYIKIPKGHTQQLLTQPVDNFVSYLHGANPQSFQQMALSMLTSALPVVGEGDNLADIGVSTLGSNTPQAIKPVAEVLMNKDTFRNKPIVDPFTEKLPPAAQFYQNTPEQYKSLGKKLNISPEKLQHLSEGYGGGLTKEFQNAQSTAQDIAAGNPIDPNKIPLLRRFRGSYSGFDTDRPGDKEPVDVDKAIQDRQAKIDLKASDKKTLKVGNTVYKKSVDKNGKVSIETKEVGSDANTGDTIKEQGMFDSMFKPAKKFEATPDYKKQAKDYLEYNEIKSTIPSDPLKKAVYQKSLITNAKKVYKDENIEAPVKREILNQLGFNEDEIRYEIATTLNNDEKALYMADRMKSMDQKRAIQFLEDSRTKSLSGDFLATKDVLEKLVDAKVITKEDMTALLSFEKQMGSKEKISTKKSGGGRKGRKLTFGKISPIKVSPIKLSSIKIPQIRKQNTKLNLTLPKKSRTMRIKV